MEYVKTLVRKAALGWEKNAHIHVVAALLALTLWGFTEYRLSHAFEPVSVNGFSPAVARRGLDVLSIVDPQVDSATSLLLSHGGQPNEFIDVELSLARLSDETARLFRLIGLSPPTELAPITYRTEARDRKVDPKQACRTFIQVLLPPRSKPSGRISFLQLEESGLDRYVEMNSPDTELTIRLNTVTPEDQPSGAGCEKLLSVGNQLSQPLPGSFPVKLLAAKKARIQFRFRPVSANSSLPWGEKNALYPAFTFGKAPARASEPQQFGAGGVEVDKLRPESASTPSSLLRVRSPATGAFLSIDKDLQVGADVLQVGFSGTGLVEVRGEKQVTDLVDKTGKDYPVANELVKKIDPFLIGWLGASAALFLKRSWKQPGKAGRGKKGKRRHK